jgi:hypothetical protein
MQAAFIHQLSSQRVRKKLLDYPAFRERFEKKEVEVRLDEN